MSSFTEQCDVISWQIYRPHHADFDGEKLPRIFQLTHEMGMYGFSARPVSCWAFLKLKFESQWVGEVQRKVKIKAYLSYNIYKKSAV